MQSLNLNIEGAAKQLNDYLYPNGFWIGHAWIQDNVLYELAANLKQAVDKKRKKDETQNRT
jgi:hypothetical protein